MGRDEMTVRERWLAALDSKPVDRLPFWPKLGSAYIKAQAEPYCSMELQALHEYIGSDRHERVLGCFREVRPRTSFESVTRKTELREVYKTPQGRLIGLQAFDPGSDSWHPVRMPVQEPEDIGILTAWYDDVRWELDADALSRARESAREIGESAVHTSWLGTTPLMRWIEQLAGVENGHFWLADYQDEVEALFDSMTRSLLARAELQLTHLDVDMFYLEENTSTTLISPDQFRRHCVPVIRRVGEMAEANGKRIVLHMCGTLLDLLPDLNELPAGVFEAFTSPPVGNTTLADGRNACPDICLIGGTNAALWTRPADEIIAELAGHLDALPHHRGLVITSAGVMPPRPPPETIKAVADWVKDYPLVVAA